MLKEEMENIYRNLSSEKIPWHYDDPPRQLCEMIETRTWEPCKAIELGCGLGVNALYLAQKGYKVTGIDLSGSAINKAQQKAKSLELELDFLQADALQAQELPKEKFDLAYDWELLHHIPPSKRLLYLRNIKAILAPKAMYYSVSFSIEDPSFGGQGILRKTPLGTVLYFSSEEELKKLFESYFSLIEINTIEIRGGHLAVCALMRA